MIPHDVYWLAYYKKHPDRLTYAAQYLKKLYIKYKHLSYDELRIIVCKNSYYAYCFAFKIDECFHHETYQACLGSAEEEWYHRDVMNIDIHEDQVEGV